MAIYLILITFILMTSSIQKQLKKTYLTICLFFIWILIAFRSYLIGNDTISYANLFPILSSYPLSMYGNNPLSILFTKNRFEFGYVLFNKVIYYFSENPRWLLIISATITICLIGYAINKYSKNPTLSLIIFVTMGFMAGTMSQIRQYIAWAICIYSIKYTLNNKPIRFICSVVLAMLFHISAIVFLPLYWLSKIKLTPKNGTLFAIITLPLFIFFNRFSALTGSLIKSYNNYEEQMVDNGTTGYLSITVNLITFILIFILAIYLMKVNKENGGSRNKLTNLLLWMLMCSFVVLILSYKFSQFSRLVSYFTCSIMFLIPNELDNPEKSTVKQVILILMVVFLILNFSVTNILRPEWSNIIPFKFMSSWWGY